MSDLRELLAEIRDHLRNLDTLAQRREKDRERKRLVRGQTTCPRTKEEEKGKETFPPAPPIEKRAKEEENHNHNNRVRAREDSAGCSQLPTVEEVAAFVREINSDIDPNYFWRYYNSNHRPWPRKWRDRLRNWTVNGIPRGRISPEEETDADATGASLPADWTLCAERCANCRNGCCACGVSVPPSSDPERPRPPEECPHFANLVA